MSIEHPYVRAKIVQYMQIVESDYDITVQINPDMKNDGVVIETKMRCKKCGAFSFCKSLIYRQIIEDMIVPIIDDTLRRHARRQLLYGIPSCPDWLFDHYL